MTNLELKSELVGCIERNGGRVTAQQLSDHYRSIVPFNTYGLHNNAASGAFSFLMMELETAQSVVSECPDGDIVISHYSTPHQ